MSTNQIAALSHGRKVDVESEISSVEAALRNIVSSDLEERVLAQIPQWFLVIDMFKKLEIPYTVMENRPAKLDQKYRAVLTSILSLGETIHSALMERPEVDVAQLGYCPKSVGSNLRYLRSKYRQRFLPVQTETVAKVMTAIESAA